MGEFLVSICTKQMGKTKHMLYPYDLIKIQGFLPQSLTPSSLESCVIGRARNRFPIHTTSKSLPFRNSSPSPGTNEVLQGSVTVSSQSGVDPPRGAHLTLSTPLLDIGPPALKPLASAAGEQSSQEQEPCLFHPPLPTPTVCQLLYSAE